MAVASVVWASTAAGQVGVPDSVPVAARTDPFQTFRGRRITYAHVVARPSLEGQMIAPNESFGTVEPYPAKVSKHDKTLNRADSLYGRQQYKEAADLLAGAYRDEPDNPFVMNAYARTLFHLDDQRDKSLEVYTRLVARLDSLNGASDSNVVIDFWFSEAYWKLASLQLDKRQYGPAAFEILRALAAGSPDKPPGVLEQQYAYLTEAYAGLHQVEFARWSAEHALRINPRDQDVIDFLNGLGAGVRAWEPNQVFSCRAGGTGRDPCIGAYSFARDTGRVRCVAPREDRDSTFIPCLRIGWVYVGEPRREVEATLGTPWQAVTDPGADYSAFAYLVYQDTVRDRSAYYIVEYETAGADTIANTVQLTGDSLPLPWDFSGIHPGDSPDRLSAQLGSPADTTPFSDASVHLRGTRWDYHVPTVSVEVVGGLVYSIRVWRPDDVPARP